MVTRRTRKPLPRIRLKAARACLKADGKTLTQKVLGAAAGCTMATISDIESGRNRQPSYVKVVSIMRALRRYGLSSDITADDLFTVPHQHPRRKASA